MSDANVIRNHILLQLPAPTSALLGKKLLPMVFGAGQVLSRTGDPLVQICFVERGLISLVSSEGPSSVETGLLGCNGVIGASALLGGSVVSATAIARVPGAAWTMTRADFERFIEEEPAFRHQLQKYLHKRLLAASHSAVAAACCTIEQRLAGWLLTAQDCLDSDQIHLTHDCIASTLGVRRPGVTVALHMLEGKQAVRSHRKCVLIRSRELLLVAAGGAYKLARSADAELTVAAA